MTHFNHCVFVDIGSDTRIVFEYDEGSVLPNISDGDFDEAITKIAAQIEDARCNAALSVEVVYETTELASLAQNTTPKASIMAKRRMDLIRQRLMERGVSAGRVTASAL